MQQYPPSRRRQPPAAAAPPRWPARSTFAAQRARRLRVLLLLAASAVVGLAAATVPQRATAADYVVRPCGVPDGTGAAGSGSGISIHDNPGSLGYMNTLSYCTNANPALLGQAFMPAGYDTFRWDGNGYWMIRTAADTAITEFTYFITPSGLHSGLFWELTDASARLLDRKSYYYGEHQGGWATIPNLNTQSVSGRFFCNPYVAGGCTGRAAYVAVQFPTLRVEDGYQPSVAATGGALRQPGALTGSRTLNYSASDRGSGIARVELHVDGERLQSEMPDSNGGKCGANFIRHFVPCPLNTSGAMSVDTSRLRDGSHEVKLIAYDATNINKGTSSTFDIVTENKPASVDPPTLTSPSRLAAGSQLEASRGTWARSPTAFAYQWLRCTTDQIGSCRAIPGQTAATYTATADDVYGRLAVKVTASNAGGESSRTSDPSAIVADEAGFTDSAPRNRARPSWTTSSNVAAPRPANQLTLQPGTWHGRDVHYVFRFKRCAPTGECTIVKTGEDDTYVVHDADVGARLIGEVIASNAAGTQTASAPETATVTRAVDNDGRDGGDERRLPDDHNRTPTTNPPSPQPQPQPQPQPRTPGAVANTRFPIDGLRNPVGGPGHIANGTGASENARARIVFETRRGKARKTATVVRSQRDRREVIRGRLLNSAGKPIAGGKLITAWQQTGGRWTAKTGVVTTRTGHFVYILPKGPTRRVKFAYFAFSDSTSYSESNAVTQNVRTPVSLRVAPRIARNGRTIRFAGTIARDGLPKTGVLVTLEARYPGSKWKQFKVVRTTRTGHFTARYRFTSTSTRTRYEFRARVAKQGLYPFEGGLSKTTAVTVHP